ncbi:MAG: DoxX family protein [Bacteroidales bacterium]|nr:DoxX family protein [Bacteroidales bacterium]
MSKFHRALSLIARFLLGFTFLFSGFVKAVDPLGTVYKIQDYLQAFSWGFFEEYAGLLAVALFSFEMLLGFSHLFGFRQRRTARLSTLFMLVMTALTLVVALTDPVKDCGCFGDALKLSNWQTFEKNVILLILSLILLLYKGDLYHTFGKRTSPAAFVLSLLVPLFIASYSRNQLPFIDFRPYKVGSHLPSQMMVPDDAPQDSFAVTFIMEKDGRRKFFDENEYPTDTAWHYVDRKEVLVRKGYQAPIQDFIIIHPQEGDITMRVLSDTSYVFLVSMPYLEDADAAFMSDVHDLQEYAKQHHYPLYLLTASLQAEQERCAYEFDLDQPFCLSDEIALKTMVRSNPGVVLLKNGVVYAKWSAENIEGFIQYVDGESLAQKFLYHQPRYMKKTIETVLVLGLIVLAYFIVSLFRAISLIVTFYRKRKLNRLTNGVVKANSDNNVLNQ